MAAGRLRAPGTRRHVGGRDGQPATAAAGDDGGTLVEALNDQRRHRPDLTGGLGGGRREDPAAPSVGQTRPQTGGEHLTPQSLFQSGGGIGDTTNRRRDQGIGFPAQAGGGIAAEAEGDPHI